ncbi:plakophilin-1 isoform X2 [Genypterus blacodes]|uniref:plakophilin-1 isoform X2 n=1 Tax=Genypterus blacodes TaxID=154954 RepID=UPI003F7628A5
MSCLDPLKSVISIGNVDDTSLALPSVNQYRSGQQRVLEQVQTVKRNRSRHQSRSGSASLSPTSPVCSDSVFTDGTSNRSVFYGNGLSRSEKNGNRQSVNGFKGSTVKRSVVSTSFLHEKTYGRQGSKSGGQVINSRSEPDLGRQLSMPKVSGPPKRLVSDRRARTLETTSRLLTNSSVKLQSQPTYGAIPKSPTKSKVEPKVNGHSAAADITMKEAVEYLSNKEEAYQRCGASFIQHKTFIDDKAKEEVLRLNGIAPLVALLRSPSKQVKQMASAALRTLSFKNSSNKEAIERCHGITQVLDALIKAESAEMQKQLTGLLWNLSSLDSLKPNLMKSAVPVLMECVVLPHTTGPEHTSSSSSSSLDPEVFFNTTGCLRNLSSAKQSNRQAMRKCRGLVDSLVSYIKDSVEEENPDDKSVENCVCILHNLTFQLEAEAPVLFNRITALARTVDKNPSQGDSGPIGCFSPQGKAIEHEHHFDFPVVEDPHPTGAGWLIHSKTLQAYLALLGLSKREETLEACCGTMQNLTANPGIVSSVMSHTIVQKLNGLQVITPLLKSSKVNLQKSTVCLVGNLAKNSHLHHVIGRKVLPELLAILSAGTAEGNESDDTLAMTCQTALCLIIKDPESSKHRITNNLISSLNELSQNRYFPKSSKAAALFLYNLWSDKDMQSSLKKQGMNKTSFVNDVTTAACKSVQVVS